MGAKREDLVIYELVEYLEFRNKTLHSTYERAFIGDTVQWCLGSIRTQAMNLIGGERIGIKTNGRKQILLDDLMAENDLDLSPNCCGVYIPADEVLVRTKYQWLAFISKQELLKSDIAISRYLRTTEAERPNSAVSF